MIPTSCGSTASGTSPAASCATSHPPRPLCPGSPDADLRQAWGELDPQLPGDPLDLVRRMGDVGGCFDFLPDSAEREDSPGVPPDDQLASLTQAGRNVQGGPGGISSAGGCSVSDESAPPVKSA